MADAVDIFERMPVNATFDEVDNPITAMVWIQHLDRIFQVFKCPEEHKAMYAVCMLRSRALVWWGLVQLSRGFESAANMTWDDFKEVFKERFCPISVEMALVEEHMNLKQGTDEPLEEFITRFEESWWFVWCYLTPEKRFIYKFVWGLRDDIKSFISPRDMTTFEKVVQAALAIESENERRLEARKDRKRKKCYNCGKTHKGECRYGSKECYECGELGHVARDCCSI